MNKKSLFVICIAICIAIAIFAVFFSAIIINKAGNYKQPKLDVTYFKDDRTNLCFARFDRRWDVAVVPCNAEVEKLAKEQSQ